MSQRILSTSYRIARLTEDAIIVPTRRNSSGRGAQDKY